MRQGRTQGICKVLQNNSFYESEFQEIEIIETIDSSLNIPFIILKSLIPRPCKDTVIARLWLAWCHLERVYPGGQPEVVHGLGGGGQVGHALVQEPEHGGSVPHKPERGIIGLGRG